MQIKDDIVLLTATDEYSTSDLDQALAEALTSPDFNPGMHLIFDSRGSIGNPSAKLVKERISILSRYRVYLDRRCAMVANDGFNYSIARLAAVFLEVLGVSMRVFATPEAARRWLLSQAPC